MILSFFLSNTFQVIIGNLVVNSAHYYYTGSILRHKDIFQVALPNSDSTDPQFRSLGFQVAEQCWELGAVSGREGVGDETEGVVADGGVRNHAADGTGEGGLVGRAGSRERQAVAGT